MGLEQDIDLLSRVTMFQDFDPEQLRLIAFGTERQFLRKGTVLYRQGAESDGGYVVSSGQIDIVMHQGEQEITLDSCTEAVLIGELALITENRRAAAAVARVDSEVLFIPRSLFHRLLREYPQMAALLHARISHSVRGMVQQMEKVHERLAGPGLNSLLGNED